jgi:hypothetical protein
VWPLLVLDSVRVVCAVGKANAWVSGLVHCYLGEEGRQRSLESVCVRGMGETKIKFQCTYRLGGRIRCRCGCQCQGLWWYIPAEIQVALWCRILCVDASTVVLKVAGMVLFGAEVCQIVGGKRGNGDVVCGQVCK